MPGLKTAPALTRGMHTRATLPKGNALKSPSVPKPPAALEGTQVAGFPKSPKRAPISAGAPGAPYQGGASGAAGGVRAVARMRNGLPQVPNPLQGWGGQPKFSEDLRRIVVARLKESMAAGAVPTFGRHLLRQGMSGAWKALTFPLKALPRPLKIGLGVGAAGGAALAGVSALNRSAVSNGQAQYDQAHQQRRAQLQSLYNQP